MDLSHFKHLFYAHILENQSNYADFYSAVPDQFTNGVIEYLFSEAYILDAVDVVIATADALRIQVHITQHLKEKVAVIPHVPVINSSFRGTATLFYLCKSSHHTLDDHYGPRHDTTGYYLAVWK